MMDNKENVDPLPDQIYHLKKQLKQQASEFISSKALLIQKIEQLSHENDELIIREKHLKSVNESLLSLWNDFSAEKNNNREMQFLLDLHTKDLNSEKAKNIELTKIYETEIKALREKIQQSELRQQEIELRHENELVALNMRIKQLEKDKKINEDQQKSEKNIFIHKIKELNEEISNKDNIIKDKNIALEGMLSKLDTETITAQKKEIQKLQKLLNETKKNYSEQILLLKKSSEENLKKLEFSETSIKKMKISMQSMQVMNENTNKLLKEKVFQTKDLNEKLEKLEINHKKSLASIKTLNSQLNRYKKEKAMIILPSTNPSPLSTERYSNKKPKKTETNNENNFSSYGEYLSRPGQSFINNRTLCYFSEDSTETLNFKTISPIQMRKPSNLTNEVEIQNISKILSYDSKSTSRARSYSQPMLLNKPIKRHKSKNPSIIPEEKIEDYTKKTSCKIENSLIKPKHNKLFTTQQYLTHSKTNTPIIKRKKHYNKSFTILKTQEKSDNSLNNKINVIENIFKDKDIQDIKDIVLKKNKENEFLKQELEKVILELKQTKMESALSAEQKENTEFILRNEIQNLIHKLLQYKKKTKNFDTEKKKSNFSNFSEKKRGRSVGDDDSQGSLDEKSHISACNNSFVVTKTMKTLNLTKI